MVPADAHGCPACPHPAVGPAIQGSPNVLTNGLPSVRVGDKGVHAACCGPNKWNAKSGSRSVFINGRSAHRLSDFVQHCGGMGRTIEGSQNVIVGDLAAGNAGMQASLEEHKIEVQLVIESSGVPLRGIKYEIVDENSSVIASGITNNNGMLLHKPIKIGTYRVRVLGGWEVVDGH